jgi:NAD(P)-dependent dehydrogenase (short-subunit alcohol dehydrogenase family)
VASDLGRAQPPPTVTRDSHRRFWKCYAVAGRHAHPGTHDQHGRGRRDQPRLQARSIKRTELPQDVVGAAVFLCAAESDFITGQTLVVDGGARMH